MDWAAQHMPICEHVREEFVADQPFAGERIGMAMHVEAKTAILVETLAEGGAEVAVTGCNPLSTHDDVSAALNTHENITSYAKRGVDDDEYYAAIEAVIAHEPTVTVDDGMDLVAAIHTRTTRTDRRHRRRGGGDDHRRPPPARDGRRRGARVPRLRGQ